MMHNLNELQALDEVREALADIQLKRPFMQGERIILEREAAGWHCFYERFPFVSISRTGEE